MSSNNAFESEFTKSLQLYAEAHANTFAWHRLYDTTTFRFASEKIYGIKNPCDYIAIKGPTFDTTWTHLSPGEQQQAPELERVSVLSFPQFYMLECKSSHNPTSYELQFIKPHQVSMMKQWQACGAKCYFIINNRSVATKHEAFLVPVDDMETAILRGTKSVRWDIMKQECPEIQKIPKMEGAWDLTQIFQ
jgi:hypothetical protein